MQVGISTFTYTWSFGVPGSIPPHPMTVYELIDKAVKFGADCIQIADNFPLTDQPPDELAAIREYAVKNKIGIEIGGRGLTDMNLEHYLELAAYFSSPILRMVIDRQDYKPDSDTVISVIHNALNSLASRGIILAIENHDRLHSSIFRQIVEDVDNDHAGICLDCVNSMGIGEGIETVLENLAPYTVNLHVKDFSVKRVSHNMGLVIEGTPAGKGFLNLPSVLRKLETYGKCRSAILELWTPPDETLVKTMEREEYWANESILYLNKIIHRI
jgi:sugar phosphate isomerase/epimerase